MDVFGANFHKRGHNKTIASRKQKVQINGKDVEENHAFCPRCSQCKTKADKKKFAS